MEPKEYTWFYESEEKNDDWGYKVHLWIEEPVISVFFFLLTTEMIFFVDSFVSLSKWVLSLTKMVEGNIKKDFFFPVLIRHEWKRIYSKEGVCFSAVSIHRWMSRLQSCSDILAKWEMKKTRYVKWNHKPESIKVQQQRFCIDESSAANQPVQLQTGLCC